MKSKYSKWIWGAQYHIKKLFELQAYVYDNSFHAIDNYNKIAERQVYNLNENQTNFSFVNYSQNTDKLLPLGEETSLELFFLQHEL